MLLVTCVRRRPLTAFLSVIDPMNTHAVGKPAAVLNFQSRIFCQFYQLKWLLYSCVIYKSWRITRKNFSEISSEVEACRGRGRKKPGASSSAVLWLAASFAPEQSCAVIGGDLLGPGAAARRCRSRHLSWDLRPQKLERKSEAGGYWGTSKEWRWTAGD